MQYMRTPDQKEALTELLRVMTKFYLNAQLEGELSPKDFEVEISETNATAHHCLGAIMHAVQATPVLERHIWCFGANITNTPLIISDSPLVLVPHKNNDVIPHTGLGSPGIQIVFPLAPDLALVMFERTHFKELIKCDGKCFQITLAGVQWLNNLQVASCRSQLYSKSSDFTFAEQLISAHPKLKKPQQRYVECSGPFTEYTAKDSNTGAKYVIRH